MIYLVDTGSIVEAVQRLASLFAKSFENSVSVFVKSFENPVSSKNVGLYKHTHFKCVRVNFPLCRISNVRGLGDVLRMSVVRNCCFSLDVQVIKF